MARRFILIVLAILAISAAPTTALQACLNSSQGPPPYTDTVYVSADIITFPNGTVQSAQGAAKITASGNCYGDAYVQTEGGYYKSFTVLSNTGWQIPPQPPANQVGNWIISEIYYNQCDSNNTIDVIAFKNGSCANVLSGGPLVCNSTIASDITLRPSPTVRATSVPG
jgi:hypothetical protein